MSRTAPIGAVATLIAAVTLVFAAPAQAQSQAPAPAPNAVEALSTCLTDASSGKDRKDLARWIFMSMAAHPEMKRLGSISAQDRAAADKAMGALMTRLMTQACGDQTRQVVRAAGSNAGIQLAFGKLGELAMQELMSNADVDAAMGSFLQYADQPLITRTLTQPDTPKP